LLPEPIFRNVTYQTGLRQLCELEQIELSNITNIHLPVKTQLLCLVWPLELPQDLLESAVLYCRTAIEKL